MRHSPANKDRNYSFPLIIYGDIENNQKNSQTLKKCLTAFGKLRENIATQLNYN
jgi:hypothetical protein